MSSTVAMDLRAEMLDLYFLKAAAATKTLYVCLTYFVAPSNAAGSQLTEPTVGGYARRPYALGSDANGPLWQASGYGEVSTTRAVEFAKLTADVGVLQGWALADTPNIGTGRIKATGSLVLPTDFRAGAIPRIPAGAIIVALED